MIKTFEGKKNGSCVFVCVCVCVYFTAFLILLKITVLLEFLKVLKYLLFRVRVDQTKGSFVGGMYIA